jgi:transcriptional regulator with XRE-family HTH domain
MKRDALLGRVRERLRELRAAHGDPTDDQIARAAGLRYQQFVGRVMNDPSKGGSAKASMDDLNAIAGVFGYTLEQLLRDELPDPAYPFPVQDAVVSLLAMPAEKQARYQQVLREARPKDQRSSPRSRAPRSE